MKLYASYEKGYKEQQVEIKKTAQTLITEAITARLNNGQIKADELALYKQKIAELTEELKEKLKTDLGNYFVGIELERATRKLKSRKEKTL